VSSEGLTPETSEDRPEQWPVRSTSDVWRGSAPFAVRLDRVAMPDGSAEFGRLVVEHPGAVVVLAVDDEERALVLRQYRHAAGTRFVELPAGLLDVPGEDPLATARRELLEEAALEAEEWTHLSSLWATPGLSEERVHTYLARGLRARPDRGGFQPEHEEADMTAHWVPVSELLDGVLAGRLTDTPLVVAVLLYALRGEGPVSA
jgi:ADP-ribose pyrophosphatase